MILSGMAPAGEVPHFIHEVKASSDKNSLVRVAFVSTNSFADAILEIYNFYGIAFGYGTAVLKFSRGVKTEKDKWYGILVNEYSQNPAGVSMTFEATGLRETIVYG